MKVIFLKDVPGAKKNQVKEVANGYALNYLLPQKLAIAATREKIATLGNKANKAEDDNKKVDNKTEKLLKTIKNLKISITAKADEEGHLFGGVGNEDIQKVLKEKHNIDINKDAINLPHHLKELGDHKVNIKINNQQAELKVIIKPLKK
jgi:large subunit ribosomal protein L9